MIQDGAEEAMFGLFTRTGGHVHVHSGEERHAPLAALALLSDVCRVIGQSFGVGVA